MSGIPFRATAISPTIDGSGWLVRYYDSAPLELNLPCGVSRHAWRWSARLAAWAYMNRRTS